MKEAEWKQDHPIKKPINLVVTEVYDKNGKHVRTDEEIIDFEWHGAD